MDIPINIRYEESWILAEETSSSIPQWAVIAELWPTMFAKAAVNSIASVLGKT